MIDFNKPVRTRCGYEVTILKTDAKLDLNRSIVGIVNYPTSQTIGVWYADGKVHRGDAEDSFDLVQSVERKRVTLERFAFIQKASYAYGGFSAQTSGDPFFLDTADGYLKIPFTLTFDELPDGKLELPQEPESPPLPRLFDRQKFAALKKKLGEAASTATSPNLDPWEIGFLAGYVRSSNRED